MKLTKNLQRQIPIHLKRIKSTSQMRNPLPKQRNITQVPSKKQCLATMQTQASLSPRSPKHLLFQLNSEEFTTFVSYLALEDCHAFHVALSKNKHSRYYCRLLQQRIISAKPKQSEILLYINSFVKIYNIPTPIMLKFHTTTKFIKDPHHQTIKADVERTYVKGQHNTHIKKFLNNVLGAVAVQYPNFGYIQGFNYVIRTMYQNGLSQTQSFAFSCHLMNKMGLNQLYANKMHKVFQYSYVVEVYLYNYIPQLYKHLAEVGIGLMYFVSSWFITLFSEQLPLSTVNRLWNIFLLKGWKVLIKFAIAILFVYKESIISKHKDALSSYLRHFLQSDFTPEREEQIFKLCMSVKVKHKMVTLLSAKMDQVCYDSQILIDNIRKAPVNLPTVIGGLGSEVQTPSCYCQPKPKLSNYSSNPTHSSYSRNSVSSPSLADRYFTFCQNAEDTVI